MPDPQLITASEPTSPGPAALRPHKELLIGWTLLLLGDDVGYGYGLHQALRLRGLDLQATSLYRWLRNFEQDRWVASYWSEAVAGPPRRLYRLTADGRQELQQISAWIAAMRDTYSTFLTAHQHYSPAVVARSPAPETLRPHRELLAGWLLLHLRSGATYGYDLRRAFDAQGLRAHGSAVYRMLRRLEADSWVQSRWLSAAAGPPRRIYRLTTRGRRNLDEIAVLIAAIRDSHDTYLRAYERACRSKAVASEDRDMPTAA